MFLKGAAIVRHSGVVAACLVLGTGRGETQEAPLLFVEAAGHTSTVRSIAFSPDQRTLISVGADKVIRLWDLATRRQRTIHYQTRLGPYPSLASVAVSPDKSDPLIAVGQYDERPTADILLFRLKTGEQVGRLPGHPHFVDALCFSPDGRFLASGGDDEVRLWDVASRRVLWKKAFGSGIEQTVSVYVRCVGFSPDGALLAAGAQDGSVGVWSVTDGKAAPRPPSVGGAVQSLCWGRDGYLYYGSRDRIVRRFKPGSPKAPDTLPPLQDTVTSVAVGPDTKYLLYGGGEDPSHPATSIHISSLEDNAARATFDAHRATVMSIAVAPDGRTAASADGAGTVLLWDIESRQIRQRMQAKGMIPSTGAWVAWSQDGKQVVWGDRPGEEPLAAFDLESGTVAERAKVGRDWTKPLVESPGLILVRPESATEVQVKSPDAKTRSVLSVDEHDRVKCFCFASPNRVILGSDLGLASYTIGKQRPQQRYLGHGGSVLAVAVSADGRFLASISVDQTVRIWELSRAEPAVRPMISMFRSSDSEWIAWAPEGYYSASPQGDRYIGWQVNQGADKAAKFYSAERFSGIFYRPDVISRLFAAGTLPKALIAANADPANPFKGTATHDVAQLTELAPPDVEIVSPADGATVREPDIRVEARLAGPVRQGVSLRAVVAEAPSARDLGISGDAPPDNGPNAQRLSVHLLPGRNTIRVFAVDSANRTRGLVSERTVVYEPEARRSRYGHLYMLCVGVSDYKNADEVEFKRLPAASVDAREVARLYETQKGRLFDDVDIKVIPDREATKARVMEALASLCSGRKPGDYVILFLSGHGMPSFDGARKHFDKPDAYRYLFAPVDFVRTAEQWDRSAVEWGWILDQLRQPPCPVVVFIDTCHSGGLGIELMRGFNVLDEAIRGAKDRGIYAITSCLPSQTSLEDLDRWGHGAFTKGIVESLAQGLAQHDADGVVSFDNAAYSISQYVKNLVKPDQQYPKAFSPPDGDEGLPVFIVR